MRDEERRERLEARKSEKRRQALLAAAGGLAVVGAVVFALKGLGGGGGGEVAHTDLSERFSELGQFREAHIVSGSLVATVESGGLEDPAAACDALLLRVRDELAVDGAVTLFDTEGRTLADCGGE